MGQKVNPHGLRVGVIKDWNTTWYADKKEFSKFLKEDNVIRTFLKKKYYAAAISKIVIERAAARIVVTIYTARPGVIIGKAGSEVEVIKKDLAKLTNGKAISINITEVRKPDCDAQLVAEGVAAQLEKRMSFRRCMKQAIGRSMPRRNAVKRPYFFLKEYRTRVTWVPSGERPTPSALTASSCCPAAPSPGAPRPCAPPWGPASVSRYMTFAPNTPVPISRIPKYVETTSSPSVSVPS